jgi:hypothetical protein
MLRWCAPTPHRKWLKQEISPMALFTVEVSGRPILVFPEEDRSGAKGTLA